MNVIIIDSAFAKLRFYPGHKRLQWDITLLIKLVQSCIFAHALGGFHDLSILHGLWARSHNMPDTSPIDYAAQGPERPFSWARYPA